MAFCKSRSRQFLAEARRLFAILHSAADPGKVVVGEDELDGMWPAVIVQKLIEVLPDPYFAAPGVHLGTLYEVNIGT